MEGVLVLETAENIAVIREYFHKGYLPFKP